MEQRRGISSPLANIAKLAGALWEDGGRGVLFAHAGAADGKAAELSNLARGFGHVVVATLADNGVDCALAGAFEVAKAIEQTEPFAVIDSKSQCIKS